MRHLKEMKIILPSNHSLLIDRADYPLVARHQWHVHRGRNTWYAVREDHTHGYRKIVRLHRYLLNPPKHKEVDHINGNGLDNRRSNLRIVTRAQNARNIPSKLHSSKYKGVSFNQYTQRWECRIQTNNKFKFLGRFDSERKAAQMYDLASSKFHGAYGTKNFKKRVPVHI